MASKSSVATPSLRVLVVERQPGEADAKMTALRAAGHDVVGCFEAGQTTLPCKGFLGEAGCPLDERPIDVALDVRGDGGPPDSDREAGVRCAMRRGVPVMVLGDAEGIDNSQWVAATLAMDDPGVEERLATIASDGFDVVARHALDVARQVLQLRGHDAELATVEVAVGRDADRLLVRIALGHERDPRLDQMIAAKVLSAIPEVRPGFAKVDVSITHR